MTAREEAEIKKTIMKKTIMKKTIMKKTARPLALLPALVVLGSGAMCEPPVEDAGPNNDEGCEVDLLFSADNAADVTLGETVTGFLCPARDVDWYKFNVDAPGSIVRVHLWMDTNLTPLEPGYTIVTDDDLPTGIAAHDEGRTPGEAPDFIGAHRIDEPGGYILKIADVEGFDDRIDETNQYSFTIEVIADPDPAEPNESVDEATAITVGQAVSGLIATNGDLDWYAIPVEADAQIVDITATAPSDIGLSLVASLYGSDGLALVDTRPLVLATPGATTVEARLRAPAAGVAGTRYYLKIEEETGLASESDPTKGTYELVVNVLADPDAQEVGGRNDSVQRATLVADGTSLTAALATYADQDLYRVDPPAGTTAANPRVVVAEIVFTGEAPAPVTPQVRVVTANPERNDGNLAPCASCPGVCGPIGGGAEGCLEDYLQRVMTTRSSYTVTFPLRRTRPVFIAVNDFGDNNFQESAGYTISFSIVDDPDPGEVGEDYLIPNLQTATYENDEELENQTSQSRSRARNISFGFQESCEPPDVQIVDGGAVVVDAGTPPVDAGTPACQAVVPVPAPGPGGQLPYYVQCNGQEYSTTASGRLAYEGDRDFFRFNVPESGYWAIDLTYDMTTTTPVELALFVHDAEQLIGSTLEAPQTLGFCESSTDCPAGSVCVDERCWGDTDSNPSFTNHEFPAPSQCLFMHVNSPRPVYLEVTDNGINDFDLGMEYTIDVRVRCGCPAACDGAFQACQGAPAPAP